MSINESNFDDNKYISPSDYPTYLWEPIVIQDYPYHERPRATVPPLCESPTESPIVLEPGSSHLDNAKSLVAANRRLGEVVRLRDASLTRAFLQAKFPTNCNDDVRDERSPWDEYEWIDADTRDSVERVAIEMDLENAEVILTLGPERYLRRRHFFFNLVTVQRDSRALGLLVQRVAEWGVLDAEGAKLIEQQVFQKASKETVRVFLQHRLDRLVEQSFGFSALAALFGNPHFKLGALRRKGLHATVAGFANFTALHYAMKSKNAKKVKYLLDRGADPNASSERDVIRPLTLALWRPATSPRAHERCVELLLQHGANPYFHRVKLLDGAVCVEYALLDRGPPLYAPAEYLMRLVLAYACLHEKLGSTAPGLPMDARLQLCLTNRSLLYYRACRRELEMLEGREVRRGLTMFDVVARTGEGLFRTVNEEDRRLIGEFVEEHEKSGTINAYYVNAVREHMRQVRKFVAHGNRAMRIVAESAAVLAPYFLVLNKIVGYLSCKDLLMFQ